MSVVDLIKRANLACARGECAVARGYLWDALVLLDAVDEKRDERVHQSVPGRMSFTVLERK